MDNPLEDEKWLNSLGHSKVMKGGGVSAALHAFTILLNDWTEESLRRAKTGKPEFQMKMVPVALKFYCSIFLIIALLLALSL